VLAIAPLRHAFSQGSVCIPCSNRSAQSARTSDEDVGVLRVAALGAHLATGAERLSQELRRTLRCPPQRIECHGATGASSTLLVTAGALSA